jgi:hypothetical protein
MFRYKFLEFSQLALGNIVLCMNSGRHYRLVKRIEELGAVIGTDRNNLGCRGEYYANYWCAIDAAPDTKPPPSVHGGLKSVRRRFTMKFHEDAILSSRGYLLSFGDGQYKWTGGRLAPGDVITDGDVDFKIVQYVEKYTPFMDYGMTGKETPHNMSYYEYAPVRGNDQIEHLHCGDWTWLCTWMKKYPVVA